MAEHEDKTTDAADAATDKLDKVGDEAAASGDDARDAKDDEAATKPIHKAAAASKTTSGQSTARNASPASHDTDELRAEVERLRKEKAELQAKVEMTPEEISKRRVAWWRMFIAIVLIVLGALFAGLAVPAVWLDRTVKDTNVWVDTVAPLAKDPGVQNLVANSVTDALMSAVDVQGLAQQYLPGRLKDFAPAIAGAVKSFVSDQAHTFTKSEQFQTAWIEANRVGQKTVITLGTPGAKGAVSNQNGAITLDIGILVDTIKARLVERGLTILNNVPTSAVQGRTITLYQAPWLAELQKALMWMGIAAITLPVLAILFLAGAIALATDRRKGVLYTGIGVVVAMLLPLSALYLGQFLAIQQLTAAISQLPADVATTVFDTIFRYLVLAQQFILVIGLLMIVAAVIAGPAKWAVALREGVSHGLGRIGEGWDFGAFGEFVLANKPVLRGAGLVIGILALIFIPGPKFTILVWIVVLEIVWLLLIEFFGRKSPSRSGPDDTDVAAA